VQLNRRRGWISEIGLTPTLLSIMEDISLPLKY
jgi:hypothetical protein